MAFSSPEEWNEQLQSLQKHVVSTSYKNLERAHQWATAIAEEIRAARDLVAEIVDAENVPNVLTEQTWLRKYVIDSWNQWWLGS